jgi:hypothetical protein
MTLTGIKRPLGRPAVWLAGVVVATMAVGASSDALARRATTTKAYAAAVPLDPAQPQKPLKLRYFGGPKSVMYSE